MIDSATETFRLFMLYRGPWRTTKIIHFQDKGLSSDGLWTQFDFNLQGDGRRNEACLPYPHCEFWWGNFSRVAFCYFKPPYRNETRVDRVPEQLAGGSALLLSLG
jgi:hypothetical protein